MDTNTNTKWGFCPNCGTEIFAWDEVIQVEDTIYQTYTCPNCEKDFCDVFIYTHTEEDCE